MTRMSVRYIVNDVEEAVRFYVDILGFEIEMQPAPGFAALSKHGVRLLINQPGSGGAGQAAAGQEPQPGGWNRIQIEVDDVAALAKKLRRSGCRLRGEIVIGRGGKQILVEDPSGNPVELFEPTSRTDG
jgi:catechol 2,3-dioxygenase-like lactoylglutathione lyase family enzyme